MPAPLLWTKEEDAILLKNYWSMPWDDLLALLPQRTKSSIYKRTETKGITRQTVGDLYKDGDIVTRKQRGRQLKFIRISAGTWILYARYVWEKVNGEVPEGYVVSHKDNDPLNCKLENLYLITHAEMLRKNGKPLLEKQQANKAQREYFSPFLPNSTGKWRRKPGARALIVQRLTEINKTLATGGKVRLHIPERRLDIWVYPHEIEAKKEQYLNHLLV